MTYDALLDICIYVLLLVVEVVCIFSLTSHTFGLYTRASKPRNRMCVGNCHEEPRAHLTIINSPLRLFLIHWIIVREGSSLYSINSMIRALST